MTERFVRLARAVFGMGLFIAMPASASDDIAADWRTLLEKGNREAIFATYDLVDAVTVDGAIDAARCRENADAIAKALVTNPVGLGLWSMAQTCARATGETALAERRADRFEALLRHMFANYRAGQELPMRVVSMRDIDAVIAASGQEQLYAIFIPYEGERHLSYNVGLWDDKTQHESVLEFDFLDTMIRLRRDDPDAEFPKFRRAFVNALGENAHEETPGSALARLYEFQQAEGPEMLEVIRRQARGGDLMAALTFGILCGEKQEFHCRDEAIDALLPLAEKRYALALTTLAFVHARNSVKSSDLKAARALIEQADRRLGDAQGSASFLLVIANSSERARLAELVEKPLEKAAKEGSLVAGLAYAAARTLQTGKIPAGRERGYIEAASAAGIPRAQYSLAAILASERKFAQALPLMRAAADAGIAEAQLWLGIAYTLGKSGVAADTKLGLDWLKQAGHSGSAKASAMVGAHYFDESSDPATLKRAQGWLQSAVLGEDLDATYLLALLYERGIPDIGTPERAAELYEALLAEHDDVRARRRLARLLLTGNGVKADAGRAETLLRQGAPAGDVESQSLLGDHLVNAGGTPERRAEGLGWLRKAAAAGNVDARLVLASALWYGRAGAPEPTAARELWQGLIRDDVSLARNELAWAVCTPRDAALLDAKAGIAATESLATRDNAGWMLLDTFASCQAGSGDYAAAVATQQRAIAQAESQASIDEKVLSRMRGRLKQYERRERAVE